MIKLNSTTGVLMEGHPGVTGTAMEYCGLTHVLTLFYDSVDELYDFLAHCPKTTVFNGAKTPEEERALISSGFNLCEVAVLGNLQTMYIHPSQMQNVPGLVQKYSVVVGYDI